MRLCPHLHASLMSAHCVHHHVHGRCQEYAERCWCVAMHYQQQRMFLGWFCSLVVGIALIHINSKQMPVVAGAISLREHMFNKLANWVGS